MQSAFENLASHVVKAHLFNPFNNLGQRSGIKEDYRYPRVDYPASKCLAERRDSYGNLVALPVLSLVALIASTFAGSALFLSGAGLTA